LVLATRGSRDKRCKELVLSKTRQDLPRCRAVVYAGPKAGRAAMPEPHDGVLLMACAPCWCAGSLTSTGRLEGRARPASTLFSFQRPRATWALVPALDTNKAPRLRGRGGDASVLLKHGCGSAYRSTPHVLDDCVRAIPLCGTRYFTQTPCLCQEHVPRWSSRREWRERTPRGLKQYTHGFRRVNLFFALAGRDRRPNAGPRRSRPPAPPSVEAAGPAASLGRDILRR